MNEHTRMQRIIDNDVDVRAAVCILNAEADAEPLACAAQARAEHLRDMAATLQGMRANGVTIEPAEVVAMFAPLIDDLAVITAALAKKLKHLRMPAEAT